MAIDGLGKGLDTAFCCITSAALLAVGSLAVAAISALALKILGFSLATIATAVAIPVALAAILALGAYATYSVLTNFKLKM